MADETPKQLDSLPQWRGSPVYDYSLPIIQQRYLAREATTVASFSLPHLQPGMTLLDCGCGPGTITFGLAEVVAPAQVAGIDLEPGMIDRAIAIAKERQEENVHFQVADIRELPFPDSSFDAVFTSAVLEHLGDPLEALGEISRILRPEGLIGVMSTDWSEPLISPADASVGQFFALFERCFNYNGGSMNRGRHLKALLHQAGFSVTEFSASFRNSSTPETVLDTVEGYVQWIEHWPLFDQAIESGWVDRHTLEGIAARMRRWSGHPDAILATASCTVVGRKTDVIV